MASSLIGLDKHLELWPVGVVETWGRMKAKCVLKVAGQEAKQACGTEQLCGREEAWIEVGINVMRLL